MGNTSPTVKQLDQSEAGNLTVYDDFNCPFCYALIERVYAMNMADRVEFRSIQHAPLVTSSQMGFEVLSLLTAEVAEVRRRAPATQINIPMFRPSSAAAIALVNAVNHSDPDQARQLRQHIYRALWVDGQDISQAEVLEALLAKLEIEAPGDDAVDLDQLAYWQSEWDSSVEFDRSIPVVISARGETLVGFPLAPELDAFLETGSLISDQLLHAARDTEERQRILVLEDEVESLQMIIAQMHETQVEVVKDFNTLIQSVFDMGMPDLVIVNTALIGGIESTDWWRNSTDSDLETAIPIIFVADDKSTEAEVAAFEAGAADFIAKPFHPKVLQARLNMHLQARRSQLQLNNIARVDALTSVCNRREFDIRLLTEWGRGARADQPLALLMIDVDKFKEYNDQHGHLRGDNCLIAVAQILSDCMQRSSDTLARYGGEEFVALLPGVDLEGALTVAEDCLESIRNAGIPHVASSVAPYVTVSIGVAAMLPIYEKSNTLLIEQADIALYQAKQSGRDRICNFDDKP